MCHSRPSNLLISLESLGSNPTLSYSCLYRCIVKALHRQGSRVHDFGFSPAILYRQMSGPPELANVRFWLLPKPRVSVPELKRRLVFLGIVLFQPKQLVDRVHRLLHDLLHFGLRYVGVFGLSRTGRTIFASVNIFDRAIAERQCDDALGFSCQLRI